MSYQTINPYTEQLVTQFAQFTDEHLATIIAAAEKTFQQDWRYRPLTARQTVLKKAAALLREHRDEFAKLATQEMGKLFREAQGEITLSANILDYYADNAALFLADKPLDVSLGEAYVATAPVGVIFCIEPWNFPFYQLARVAGPNLMAGNTIIAKHSPNVPLCALAFEKLFLDAGAPDGLYTNVFISNEQAATVIADTRIRGVALTGSERAGAAVAAEAGKALKKSTMELGGSDAFIVLDDANLDDAVKWGVSGRLFNAGQVCDAAKRFILDETIADDFLALFKRSFESIKAGDPMDPTTTLAPLSSKAALELALNQIESAVNADATLLTGGKRMERPGFFLEPTILTNVRS